MRKGDDRWCELAKDRWTHEEGYGVYVVELGRGAARYLGADCEPGFPCLYVGQSAHSAERRMWTHLCQDGANSSSIVKGNARFLRYDLFKQIERFSTRVGAMAEEEAHAWRLARVGFHTYYDGKHVRPMLEPDAESEALRGANHIRAVADYVDQAIFSVIGSLRAQAVEPDFVSVSQVARILTDGRSEPGSLGATVQAERRFAYSHLAWVEQRLLELIESGPVHIAADGGLAISRE